MTDQFRLNRWRSTSIEEDIVLFRSLVLLDHEEYFVERMLYKIHNRFDWNYNHMHHHHKHDIDDLHSFPFDNVVLLNQSKINALFPNLHKNKLINTSRTSLNDSWVHLCPSLSIENDRFNIVTGTIRNERMFQLFFLSFLFLYYRCLKRY